ncbi:MULTISPECIES: hypothetical protein [Desulfofundulus]|uniref:Uncharacterized protein n=1 Tax=Desulfofundulus salinus TaxID=2419843 RepID=A0A494WZJ5_9FIRM|nr:MULTISPECIES: hypothetical protein [Desulfofundulus]NHM26943.1 hypothetical protein [Desulfofundulus sp. TPOSR]RKO66367.1 hypothetical protein D7024_05030 [Desulfofundulus salinum]
MKRAAALFFALLLLLFPLAPALAQVDLIQDQPEDAAGDPWAPEDRGGTFEKIVASLITFPIRISEGALKAAGFKSIDQLVFLEGVPDDQKRFVPWETEGERGNLREWFVALCSIAAPFYLIVIAVTAFKFFYAAANPGARREAMESIQRWFLAVGIIVLAPFVLETFMWLSSVLLDGVEGAFQYVVQGTGRSVGDWGVNFGGVNVSTGSVLATAVVKLAFFLFFCYLNVIYLVRKLALTVFYVFTPLMALMWAGNKNVTAAAVWLGELASNAFMPVAHALVLGTILILADVKNLEASWLAVLIYLYTVVPLSEVLRNSMMGIFTRAAGLNEKAVATGAMAALGLGGVVSLARLGAATFASRPLPLEGESPASGGGEAPEGPPPGGWGGTPGGIQPAPRRQAGFTSPDLRGEMPAGSSGSPPVAARGMGSSYGMLGTHSAVGQTTHPVTGSEVIPPGSPLKGRVQNPSITGLLAATDTASRAGEFARTGASIAGGFVGGVVPGGEAIVKTGASLAAAMTRGASVVAGTTLQAARRSKEEKVGFGEALKAETGAGSVTGAAGRVLSTAAMSAWNPALGQRQAKLYAAYDAAQRGLDGLRYRN